MSSHLTPNTSSTSLAKLASSSSSSSLSSKAPPIDMPIPIEHTFATDSTTGQHNDIVVLKIGSSSISKEDGSIQLSIMSRVVELTYALREQGYTPVIVTSGAVSVGSAHMRKPRPTNLIEKQAMAAIGQSRLMRLWSDLFAVYNINVAQLLLTRDNISNELHYLNALRAISQVLQMQVVPIINENDSVSVMELKIGDNDSLSALVASMLKAKWLFLITDVDALYSANPKIDPTAYPIRIVSHTQLDILIADNQPTITKYNAAISSNTPFSPSPRSVPTQITTSGQWGTGGMITKLYAAQLASYAGVTTCIISNSQIPQIRQVLLGEKNIGTIVLPNEFTLTGREKFIMIGVVPSGTLFVSPQVATALSINHRIRVEEAKLYGIPKTTPFTLSPSDLSHIEGNFRSFACCSIVVANDQWLREQFPHYTAHPLTCNSNDIGPISETETLPIPIMDLELETSSLTTNQCNPHTRLWTNGLELGRGLVNFTSDELLQICGQDKSQLADILGYLTTTDVIDPQNLAVHHHC